MNRWMKEMVRLGIPREGASKLFRLHYQTGYYKKLSGKDELAHRAKIKQKLDTYTVDGVYAMIVSGMDCDCSRFNRVYHVANRGVMAYVNDEWHAYKNSEGPLRVQIADPTTNPEESTSRDLALEAFEDGHPSTVYI